ncbi:MAG: hypothetical protein AAFR81_23590 [Chloroflexota bacterium]
MTKIIVLTGLVSVEKVALSQELATHFSAENTVTVIDNMARLALDRDELPDSISLVRQVGDDMQALENAIRQAKGEVVLVAVTEQAHPEKLFVSIENLRERLPDASIFSLAMIDTRTCDCFPNVRAALEMYADMTVMMPYDVESVIDYVSVSS